jgi:hypothetical protein
MSDKLRSVTETEYDRLMALDGAVRRIIALEADDVCWRDAYTDLAKLVGVDYCPQLICDDEKMLANCGMFIRSLKGGPYIPVHVRERRPENLDELLAICRSWKLTAEEIRRIEEAA